MLEIHIDSDLRLKQLCSDDALVLFRVVDQNRSHLKKWLPWLDFTKTTKDTEAFITTSRKNYDKMAGLVLGIWYKENLVGTVSFNTISLDQQTASIGYWLSKEYEGKGIVTRSCRELIEFGFKTLKLRTITLSCAEHNTKSQAIAKRLGLSHTGTIKNKEWLYDHYVNHTLFSIHSKSWRIPENQISTESMKDQTNSRL